MKKTITIVCDIETTISRLLNQVEFEVVSNSKEDIWTMIEREEIKNNKKTK